MCKPLPGPRCSNHTQKEYREKRQTRLNATNAVQRASKHLLDVERDDKATTHQVRQAKLNMEESLDKLHSAEEAEKESLKAWYSSPDGILFLSGKVQAADVTVSNTKEEFEQGNADEDAVNAAKNERNKWQGLLDEAQDTRRYQKQAQYLVNSTSRNLKALEPGSAAARDLTSLTDEGRNISADIDAKEAEIITLNKELVAAQNNARSAIGAVNSHRAYVKRHEDAMARMVHQAYLDEGVDSTLAKHYTLDTMATFQSGWSYLSDNSPERVPKYGGDFKVKVKDGDAKTHIASEKVWAQEGFLGAYESVREHQADYSAAVPVAQQANRDLVEKDVKMKELLSERDDLIDKRNRVRNRYNVLRAGYGGGTQQVEHYDVSFGQFVKSSYVSPEGKTNAFVFSDSLSKKVPVFARVEKVSKDEKGNQVIVTEAGERLSANDMRGRQLRLLRPVEGSERIFSNS